jgi:hypothetical protein
MGAEYFAKNREKIRKDLLEYGAIWFRGFDLMKSVAGNREMHEALSLQPCLDPLHSSGLRKFASERDALYEEVRPNIDQLVKVVPTPIKFLTCKYFSCKGEQTILARTLHWLALRIHDEANCCLCSFCMLSKGH